jgi:hypothetical protein
MKSRNLRRKKFYTICLHKKVKAAHPDKNNVGGFDGDVRSGGDGDADVGLGQRWGVVNPVADHGDLKKCQY